jgi:hypothetical protein
MTLKNNVYDILKFIAQIVLPALATCYLTLSGLWGFPYPTEIAGTISAIDVLLGAILGLSSASYEGEGKLIVDENDPEKDLFNLELNTPIEELPKMKTITFKVVNNKN